MLEGDDPLEDYQAGLHWAQLAEAPMTPSCSHWFQWRKWWSSMGKMTRPWWKWDIMREQKKNSGCSKNMLRYHLIFLSLSAVLHIFSPAKGIISVDCRRIVRPWEVVDGSSILLETRSSRSRAREDDSKRNLLNDQGRHVELDIPMTDPVVWYIC